MFQNTNQMMCEWYNDRKKMQRHAKTTRSIYRIRSDVWAKEEASPLDRKKHVTSFNLIQSSNEFSR